MITLENVTIHKKNALILDSVTHTFQDNGWSCIIGPNGAGKTTLLRSLLGGENYSGSIKINGQEVYKNRSNNIAYIPQNPTIPSGMNVWEYVCLARTRYYQLLSSRQSDRNIAAAALEQMELLGLYDHNLSTLSGGELQRVLIARAIAQQPEIILLDEPTSALDLHHQMSVLNHIEKLKKDGVRIITVMHDLTVSALYCDDLLLMDSGKAVISGKPDEVIHSPMLQKAFKNRLSVFTLADGNPVVYGKRDST